jgi:glycosyltransferase involved in cell wall biosynthesis
VSVHVTLVSGIDPGAPGAGGTRSYVLGLAERLPKRGVGVTLVARDGTADLPGVDYVRLRSGSSSPRFLMRLFASAPGLSIPPDSILHAQRPDDIAAFLFAKRRNPKVCTLHGIPAIGVRRRKGAAYGALYGALERAGLRRTRSVIAVDAGTARWYEARYPWLVGRTTVIPVAVDTVRFRPMDRAAARDSLSITAKHVLLFAGRLTPEKRVDAILRALPKVPDAQLLVAGDGPERARLAELAKGHPVRFLGAVAHEEMPRLMNAADLLVLPSEYEGLATVAIEALACGTPVVATPVGGLPEVVVPGRTGWLVDGVDGLGAILTDALPQAPTLRDACVAAAQAYAWDAVLDRILAVYRGVAA